MSDELFASLVVAAISGLAYVAYNHHILYRQHASSLVRWIYVVAILMESWNISNWVAAGTLLKFVPAAQRATANAAVSGFEIDNRFTVAVIGAGIFAQVAHQLCRTFHKGAGTEIDRK